MADLRFVSLSFCHWCLVVLLHAMARCQLKRCAECLRVGLDVLLVCESHIIMAKTEVHIQMIGFVSPTVISRSSLATLQHQG